MAIRLKYDPVASPIIASYASGVGQANQRRRKEAQVLNERNLREQQYQQRQFRQYKYNLDLQNRRQLDRLALAKERGKEDAAGRGLVKPPPGMLGGLMDRFMDWLGGGSGATPPPTEAPKTPSGSPPAIPLPSVGEGPDSLRPPEPTGPARRPPVPERIARGEESIAKDIGSIDQAIRELENSPGFDMNDTETRDKHEELLERRKRLYDSLTPVPEPPESLEDARKIEQERVKETRDAYEHNDKQRERQEKMKERGATAEQAEKAFPLTEIPGTLGTQTMTAPDDRSAPTTMEEAYEKYLNGDISLEEYQEYKKNPELLEKAAPSAGGTPTASLPESEAALKSGALTPDEYTQKARQGFLDGDVSEDEYSRAITMAKRQEYVNTIKDILSKYDVDDVREIPDSDARKAYRTAMRELENLDKELRGESTVITT